MIQPLAPAALTVAAALVAAAALWPGPAAAQGSIYTCIDSKGRRITSDRPIAECNDREQRELNPSGTVRRNVGPTLTVQERAAQEEREKKEAEERARVADERRRDRALLNRYQNKAVHDRERSEALKQVDEVIVTANTRVTDLQKQRGSLDAEMEFYKKDPAKAPGALRRQITENEQNLELQKRFIADQDKEKARINTRFDDELVRLRYLWAQQAGGTAARTN